MPKTRRKRSQPKDPRIPAEASTKSTCRILILGIGGAGNQTVSRLVENGIVDAECIAINTDLWDLNSTNATRRVLIGEKVTQGLSAGGNPAIGRSAIEESRLHIESLVENAGVVFIVAGLGGGTGTGAAPIVAEIARHKGAITVAAVTMPLRTEKDRILQAEHALNEMRRICDTVIVIDNNKMVKFAAGLPTTEAFKMANLVLANVIRGIVENFSSPGIIDMDLAAFKTVVKTGGIAAVGVGESSAPNRAEEAVRNALATPLLDIDCFTAKGALVDVRGDANMTIEEVNRVEETVMEMIGQNVSVSCGARVNNDIGSGLRVTIVITGMDSPQMLSRFRNVIPELHDIESSFAESNESFPVDLALDQIESFED